MQVAQPDLPALPVHPAWRRAIIAACAIVVAAPVATASGLAGMAWAPAASLSLFSTVFGDRGARIERDVGYGVGPRRSLDVYRPAEGVREHDAIIVFLYGGSWSSGDKATYGFVGQALASRGFTTVIPDYRLYPEVQFPAFVDDVAAAYAWTSRTLAGACTPARPIIIAGHSAGAHMAVLLALDRSYIARAAPDAPRPAAIIGLAGPYTFEPTTWPSTKDAFASVAATPNVARPITFVTPDAPPMLLLHGLADDLVNLKNTRELAAALQAVGTPVKTAEYDGIGHIGLVLTLSRPFRWRAPALEKIVEYAARIAPQPSALRACRESTAK
ncbi:MAG: alpha/beta hydrolase [Hyphomicrobium sp.]